MSKTTAVRCEHVCYKSLYISLLSSAKQECEMIKFAYSEECKQRRSIFHIFSIAVNSPSNWKEEAWNLFNCFNWKIYCNDWLFFTFIYKRSSNMNHYIYTSHHFTPNVRLHSSFCRVSRWYRRHRGFESRWSTFFSFQTVFFFPTA